MHGGGVGLKSYCTDAENWHLHLSMFLTQKQCVVGAEEMSVVETEQMSAVETRQLPPTPTPPAAPRGLAPTRSWGGGGGVQVSCLKRGHQSYLTADICSVSTTDSGNGGNSQ